MRLRGKEAVRMEQEAGNRLREQELSGAEKRKKGTGTWWKVLLAVVLTLAVCVGGLLLLLGKNGRALLEGYFLARYAFVEADADLDDATDQALDALVNGLGDRWSYYRNEEDYQALITRPALHSAALALRQPVTGQPLSWRLPLPPDMARLGFA